MKNYINISYEIDNSVKMVKQQRKNCREIKNENKKLRNEINEYKLIYQQQLSTINQLKECIKNEDEYKLILNQLKECIKNEDEYKLTCQHQLSTINKLREIIKGEYEDPRLFIYINYIERRNLELEKSRYNNARKLNIESIKSWSTDNEKNQLLKEWIIYAHELEKECQETKGVKATNYRNKREIENLKTELIGLEYKLNNYSKFNLNDTFPNNDIYKYEDGYLDLDLALNEFHEDINLF